eukprot:CAMPEP_0202809910 /NCGR_PEP_ID=MMETSP1389-20130828/2122_1 /ASSEMBLY_ACC=CAM_ASM_000865 /TAXON_ID=302021 /ORGANISM="Rhodomonas sp., Strain CCMP768" /LENGTH=344 /DNA_ID=CAMNT_0049480647 /DNA_START=8 /DNA_END=1042 /DNA_ORIENTATION=+
MLRQILLVAIVATASAFSTAPATMLRSSAGRPVSMRPAHTSVKMMEGGDLFVAALPGLAALGVSLQNQGGAATAAAPMAGPSPEEMLPVARENFNKWNGALQTKDPKAVANLYSTSGLSFLPTVSPQHIKKIDNTEQYFVDFVKKNPFGTITDDSVTVFDGGNSYLHSGMYTFELGEGDARAPVAARFSYVWRKFGGDWKITHHHSSVRPAQPDMLDLARTNFNKWNDALQTKDPKKVAALYSASDLSFLPTVSPQHIKGIDSTEQYFIDFVKKNPFGTITDDSVTVFDDGNAYLHSGMYTFELGEPSDRTPVEARFSYVWRNFDGEWKITHHHSSVRPAPATA